MAELLAAWPAAVGPEIARNAWPARIARDGTVHVNTTDAIWAFELGHRGAEIAARLAVERLRFAPGPLPSGGEEPEHARPRPGVQPSAEEAAQAAAIAATVDDGELRALVARAAALSLARARSDRSF